MSAIGEGLDKPLLTVYTYGVWKKLKKQVMFVYVAGISLILEITNRHYGVVVANRLIGTNRGRIIPKIGEAKESEV